MNRSRGNASLVLLSTALMLLVIAQLFFLYVGREYERHLQYLRAEQLRLFCFSAMESLAGKTVRAGSKQWFKTVLYPGEMEACVSSTLTVSDDQCVSCLEVQAECNSERQLLRQVKFSLPKLLQQEAAQCGIISSAEVVGAEFLPQGTLYTSGREVIFPRAKDCAWQAVTELPMDVLRLNGLCRRFYYLDDYRGVAFTSGMKIYGSGLIAAEGSITIADGCEFTDDIILFSEQKIKIGRNVKLPHALLLAKKGISVGSGCRIGGVLLSGGRIEFTGSVDFSHDENLVAGFTSVYYIL